MTLSDAILGDAPGAAVFILQGADRTMYSGQHAVSEEPPLIYSIVRVLLSVLVVAVLAALMNMFVFRAYEIPSGSMKETIQIGDRLFSEKVTYYFRDPEPGEIVTFQDPEIASRILIKRVIAKGGQTVDLVDGVVTIDGVPLNEPYTDGKPSYPLTPAIGVDISYPYTVPEGMLWVMGDNRTDSQDSRYFGPIPVDSVTGKAALVYWPLQNFGLLKSEL